ncbi:protein phosphatase 2C domain-containing protein [Streptomyces sp. NBC_00576]|uniref:protein phosphatase 2C domain-containing protein n=1 Tax=Streptomyces sp. NBC_00576 TaxID=2903665 RepID=UPI002E81A02D|nr:protein phosphatase 2C domain-containing protein [Streptomyces sp. NBC_00576]WUB70934.1 protein phosphatase 2C domain-containing protein [Streptomyces sp. NBC_00576]
MALFGKRQPDPERRPDPAQQPDPGQQPDLARQFAPAGQSGTHHDHAASGSMSAPDPGTAPDTAPDTEIAPPEPAPESVGEPVRKPVGEVVGAAIAGHWRPIVVGKPVPPFETVPPRGLSYRPDTVCDGWQTGKMALRLASVRGNQHRYEGRPREDDAAAAWDQDTGTVVFAVADGVSSARQPHIGSQLACRSAVDEMLNQVRGDGEGYVADWDKLVSTVHWQLVEQARRILHRPDAGPEETAELLATTLVAGTATPTDQGVFVHLISIGDSGAWQIKHDRFYRLTGGKAAAGTDGLYSSTVDPLPFVPGVIRPLSFALEQCTVLLVGTDGFGDPLGDGTGAVARHFYYGLQAPVPPLGFAHLLDFSRETYDDDRTLIALWPWNDAPGGTG